MNIASLNIKGLTDPRKSCHLKQWLLAKKEKIHLLCLQEIKVNGASLQERLRGISKEYQWVNTEHTRGSGGAAIGIHES
eukprot:c6570_g1_i1 orf=1-234(-)